MQSFDSCTKPLGPLKQTLFSCLTCNPPPSDPSAPYTAAGICYSCSISCHGEHTLVELFTKRNFVCDCGTTRLVNNAPCTLRADERGVKGVSGEEAREGNAYNQNFGNRFCGCGEVYDADEERGTMFQCLGLGTVETGGCGEDWWHPECLVGMSRDWNKGKEAEKKDDGEKPGEEKAEGDEDPPLPPGFPGEDDFDTFICYKCVESNPWIKRYAGTPGFLPAVYKRDPSYSSKETTTEQVRQVTADTDETTSKKRKLDEPSTDEPDAKRAKEDPSASSDPNSNPPTSTPTSPCKYASLPPPPTGPISLFLTESFRTHLCHCPSCFPHLKPHLQLREEEDLYEPPLSETHSANGAQSTGTNSLLDLGEAALSNVDRVRAIEGVMVYNHLKEKVKAFLKPFAESGEAVSAEAIKGYFERLRGDEGGISEAAANAQGGADDNDNRREQSG